MLSKRLNRREAIQHTTLAGATLIFGARNVAARTAVNEKLNIAVVGAGGRGEENLKHVALENIVALCDVEMNVLDKARIQFPQANTFQDFRKMFDSMHAEIDAVVVSTPDHMHAPICLAAIQLGKHVYCEKPLAWGIAEARQMAVAAKRQKVATQMGTQGMAMDRSRAGIEIIRSGALGQIRELHVWTDRPCWPQGIDRPLEKCPVPKDFDWNSWLGVAPQRPYHSSYAPFAWRGWKDFGTGAIGDMGIHNAAMPLMALQLGMPQSVEILETSGLKAETYPEWSTLCYKFSSLPDREPVVMYWYDGGKLPPENLLGKKVAPNGAIVVGTQGMLYSREWTGSEWFLLPENKFLATKIPEPSIPRAPGQDIYLEWIEACKGGSPTFCNFSDYAAPLTEIMLVGALALRVGKNICWNSEKMQAEGCSEAEPYIHRIDRKGW